ncbi:hypothetical protein EJ066_23730 [Mesorhizobium sp. M9A.F.Ca.ET.002.03.1.2]|uniref:hypothetical protein n=1 Tax=Mesorhizobium sp. M9A.F.Ca.ET.002.03.1.2 TaxID=2493668 RepID=UPI000F75AF33|nr:hypothetical protein [Mesorhizobium sp. M9A.F.Ca.ET.002.03.1.2]AZN99895.1 hypothetical protein EJ066_23730 [Mesorhizobium sp. M9A.F.Ca.ET.002.03.1.2]
MSVIDAPRWLALLIAVLIAVSPILYGGRHVHASMKYEARIAVEYHHAADAMTAYADEAPCNGGDEAQDNGDCCVSFTSCFFCVPMPAQILVGLKQREPFALAPSVTLLPGETSMELRPPKLIVTV